MRRGVIISVAFHVVVGVMLAVGIPMFDDPPKLSPAPVPVELVRFDRETNAPKGAEPEPEEKRAPDADRSTTKAPLARDPNQGDKGKAERTVRKAEPEPKPKVAERKPDPPKPAPPKPAPPKSKPKPVPVPEATPKQRVDTAPKTRPAPPKTEPKQVARATPPEKPEPKEPVPKAPEPKTPEPKTPEPEAAEEPEPRKQVATQPRRKPPTPRRVARAEPEREPAKPERPEQRETRKRGDARSMDSVFKTVKELKRSTRTEDDRERTRRPEPVGRETATNSAPLTISELAAVRQQIQPCWNFPAGAKDPERLTVRVTLHLRPDGSLIRAEVEDGGRAASDNHYRAAVEAALRAVRNPTCSPLKLPRAKYDRWKALTVEFDPAKLKSG